jgi:large subunit ribosomal protein L13
LNGPGRSVIHPRRGAVRPEEPLPHLPARPQRTTRSFDPPGAERSWVVVDASEQVVGRLASRVASVLRGKHKPTFTPHADCGDGVIVVNARRVRLTGRKRQQKLYHRHTGHIGHLKTVDVERLLQTHPERVIQGAVRGMLPKGPLGRRMLAKLRVYADAQHPHAAQQPQPLELGR